MTKKEIEFKLVIELVSLFEPVGITDISKDKKRSTSPKPQRSVGDQTKHREVEKEYSQCLDVKF
jgi:hypothetical protein